MSNAKTLDRIRKLLRLAKGAGTTPAEAETALLMAQKLIAESGLEEGAVEEVPAVQEIIEGTADDLGRTESWRGRLAFVIAKNFRCECYWNKLTRFPIRNLLVFLGHTLDVEIAKEVYSCAVEAALREVDVFLRARGLTGSRANPVGRRAWNEFLIGFTTGLSAKYAEQVKKNKWALVIVTPADVLEAKRKLKLSTLGHRPSLGDDSARAAGHEAGKKFEATRKVGAASAVNVHLLKGE